MSDEPLPESVATEMVLALARDGLDPGDIARYAIDHGYSLREAVLELYAARILRRVKEGKPPAEYLDSEPVTRLLIRYADDGLSWRDGDIWRSRDCVHYFDIIANKWRSVPREMVAWLCLKLHALELLAEEGMCERPGCNWKARVVMTSTTPQLPPFWAVCETHRDEALRPPVVTEVLAERGRTRDH